MKVPFDVSARDRRSSASTGDEIEGTGNVRVTALVVGFAAMLVVAALVRIPFWTVRLQGARLANRVPTGLVPRPLRVLPPPSDEYLGVWEVTPETARERLLDRYGFDQQVRAYLHAYERDGGTAYEVASCAHRPEGMFGDWQLHVRLFPAPEGRTDVWCHWERNPNVSPLAHLRHEGYDPEEGKRRFLDLVETPTIRVREDDPPA